MLCVVQLQRDLCPAEDCIVLNIILFRDTNTILFLLNLINGRQMYTYNLVIIPELPFTEGVLFPETTINC